MAKKVVIPWELKYDFAIRGWTSVHKGWLYAIRKKYGAPAALELYEMVMEMEDRVKNVTNAILTIFKIEGHDIEAIGEWFDIWSELCGQELSKTNDSVKVIKCRWKTGYKDLSDWCNIWQKLVVKTINPMATIERIKEMCAGDPYCEFITKIEE